MQTPPTELQKIVKSGGLQGDLMAALVEARKKNENEKNKKAIEASLQQDPRTIAQQFEDSNNEATQNEVARGIGGVLAQKKKRADTNMQKIMNQGISRAPVRKPMTAAQGGIVGYARGEMVALEDEDEMDAISGDQKKKIIRKPTSNIAEGLRRKAVGPYKQTMAEKAKEKSNLLASLAPKNMPTVPQQIGLGQDTATLDAMSQAPVGGIAAVAPAQTTPVQATTKVEETPTEVTPKQETPKERGIGSKEYDDWFDVFVQTLAAKDGQYAKAYIDAKTKLSDRDKAAAQQVIDNKNTEADINIRREANEQTKIYNSQVVAGRALSSLQDDLQKLILESTRLEEMYGIQYDLPDLTQNIEKEKGKGEGFIFGTSAEKVKEIQADIDAAKEGIQLQIKQNHPSLVATILGIQNAMKSFEKTLGIPSINPTSAPATGQAEIDSLIAKYR